MELSRWTGPLLFGAGLGILAFAMARGEASLSLVVILPVVVATGALGALAIVLLVAGFFLTFFAWPFRVATGPPEPTAPPSLPEPSRVEAAPGTPARTSKRWGGVLFLGPIPVVFGSDARVTRTMLLLGVILFLALLGLTIVLFLRGV